AGFTVRRLPARPVLDDRDPGALVLVALPGLGEEERVRAVRVRDQRRGLAVVRPLPLAADDVRVAARRGDVVVVALEGAVAREGAVPRVRRRLVHLQRGRERRAAVERLLVVAVDRVGVERAPSRLVALP